MQDTKHVTQAVHADEIAKILNLFYGDFGKFTNDSGNVVMSFHEKYPPSAQIFSEMQMFASGYKQATDELATLRAQNAELREALEAITGRAEAVSDGIVVEKRNPGVSQATHVSHMASHLAQHAKKARAILAKYGDDNGI